MLVIGNTKMFRHPKYYKELRKRNKSDRVISGAEATAEVERATGPGLKQQASSQTETSSRSASLKHQATSCKAASTSIKRQATSCKLSDPRTTEQEN